VAHVGALAIAYSGTPVVEWVAARAAPLAILRASLRGAVRIVLLGSLVSCSRAASGHPSQVPSGLRPEDCPVAIAVPDPAAPVYNECAVTGRPDVIACSTVTYPVELRRAGIQGRVVIEIVLDTLGRIEPGSTRLVLASHPGFESAGRTVVSTCRFRPAQLHGRPVRVRVRVPVNWTITRG
jgi:TonB family protein